MRLLATAGDIDASIAQIRLTTPLEALCQSTGWSLAARSFIDCTRHDLDEAEVLVVQRAFSGRAWCLQRAMRLRGGAVIYDIDDLLTDLPDYIPNHQAVTRQATWLQRCLREADVVTTSTRRLADALGLPDAVCAPNYAVPVPEDSTPVIDGSQPVTLLFASTEPMGTAFIYPALRAVQGPQVKIIVVGPAAQAFREAGVHVQAHALMAREAFFAFARSQPNAVAVIPLEASRFASCKSAIKWFEFSESRIPVLCSRVSPYDDVVDDTITGLLVDNDMHSWQTALDGAIRHFGACPALARAARVAVRERHSLGHTWRAWQAAIERATAAGGPDSVRHHGLVDRLHMLADGMTLGLRQANRARLARRQRRL